MRRLFLIALAAALLGVGLLAGCGGDDDDNGGSGDTQTESKQQDTTQTDSTEQGEDTESEDQGGGGEDQFNDAYGEINDDLRALGEKVGQAVNTAKGKSDATLATQFTGLGEETEEIKNRLDELDPPSDLTALRDRLSDAVEVVASDLSDIGQAAEDHDASAARQQASELVRHSVEVRTARRELARKTGATV